MVCAVRQVRSETCNVAEGTAGTFGSCILPVLQSIQFAYDQGDTNRTYYTLEAKMRSDLDGRFDFLPGASRHEGTIYGGYHVLANTLDLVSHYGSVALGAPPLYPGSSTTRTIRRTVVHRRTGRRSLANSTSRRQTV